MELIDRNALLQEFEDGMCVVERIDAVNNAPTVDAVEVVRCADCKHWRRYSCDCRYAIAAQMDGFCSRGAKMEGEE